MSGVFITFEGPDASGKSTQIDLLAEALRKRGLEPVITREPGGTPIGESIRKILLDPANRDMSAMTEMLLYAASRAQHVEQVIKPALEKGLVVISDRFTDSSVAYQGYGRGLGALVTDVNKEATGGLVPDITFLLMAPENAVDERRPGEEKDRIESEDSDFRERVSEGFLEIQRTEPYRVLEIDGSRPIDDIAAEIFDKTLEVLERAGSSCE